MKKLYIIFVLFLFVCACSGSGSLGGTEFGNPTRELTGTVVSGATNALVKTVSASCVADSVIITDAAGATVSASLESDCSFSLDAPVGKSYLLSFLSNNSFIANLIFARDSTSIETTIFHVVSGTGVINLGNITLIGSRAIPGTNPLTQNDRDGNGINDFDDDDDDGDGVSDDDEEDCDFDGFWDDDDECLSDDSSDDGDDSSDNDSSGEGSSQGSVANILQVYPYSGDTLVSLDEDVLVKANCTLDETSIEAAITIQSEFNDVVICDFSLGSSDSRVQCEHEVTFDPLTEYTVSVDGLRCLNGDSVEVINWSFTTGFDED